VISNCSLVSSRPAFPLHRLLNNVMRSVKARPREGGASNSISRSSGLVSVRAFARRRPAWERSVRGFAAVNDQFGDERVMAVARGLDVALERALLANHHVLAARI